MTATVIYEPIQHYNYAFPLNKFKPTSEKSYYKFYQAKCQGILIENRSNGKYSREKQVKTPLYGRRSTKEYMNFLKEKLQNPVQTDDYGKRTTNIIGIKKQRTKDNITYTVTQADVTTITPILSNETRPKSILKTKQSPYETKRQRVASAPANNERNLQKKLPVKIPEIQIDDMDNDLSKSDGDSYTRACSSTQTHTDQPNQYAQQAIIKTIMLHIQSNTPADTSKWTLYHDYAQKISTSISPKVYRNYERIVL